MNANCYKVIFSKRSGTLVAVGEHIAANSKAASGQGNRCVTCSSDFSQTLTHGFIGVLRLSFASAALACLTLGNTQAQSNLPAIASSALPRGASINTGEATISTTGAQMAITQSSDKASINWQSFNVGIGASVNIAQPSTSAVLLNRVVSHDPSQILGKLSANGQVILLNPNGILFGKDGSVTASTFTASTFGLSDADFMNGFYKYNRNGSTASVVNQGSVEVASGGFVALIGATVTNEGKIIAPQGDVVLAAGESVTLPEEFVAPKPNTTANTVSVRMSKRVRLEIDPAAINTAINNTESGVIVTEGGQVLLQAAAISSAVASVTHSGNIDTSAPQAGAVTLLADNGVIKVDGSITSNSSGNHNGTTNRGGDIIIGRDEETGALSKTTDVSAAKLESSHGFVETSGQHIIVDGVQVKADQWLLDPTDITITTADSGIASTGTNPITLAPNTSGTSVSTINTSTLETNLSAGTNVIVKTTNASGTGNGDITVASNIAITGSSDATLTLQAERDIVINSNVSIARTGTNKLNVVLNSDLDGNGAGAIKMNSGSSISTNGGNITLGGGTAGDGSGNAIGNATYNSGIALSGVTLSAGGGHISLKGQSGTTGTTDYASGISITESSSISTTGAGNISLTGSSVATSGSQDTGIRIIGTSSTTLATITGGSTGSVSMTGTATNASTSGSYQHGIQLQNVKASTTGGNISLTGTGGTTSGTSAGTGNNRGIAFESAAEVSATGAGTVTLTGVGGSGGPSATSANLGVSFNNTNNIKSESGAISINASAPDNTSYAASLGGTIASSSNGNITVTTDSISLGGTISTGTGNVTVQNATAGTYITAGGTTTDVRTTSPKTMVVDATELGKITASTTVIGRNDATGSGNVTVNAINMGALGNTAGNLTVLSGNDITVSGAVTKSTGTDATLTLNAVNGIDINAAIGATSAGAGKLNMSMTANGNAANAANSKGIALTKVINANGGTVNLTATNKNTAQNKYAVSFGNGSGITAETYTVLGTQTLASTNSGGYSAGVYFSGTSSFSSTGASLINGVNNSQFTAFTAGTWFDDGANASFNAGASGSLVVKGANPNWKNGVRVGRGGGNITPTVTTDGNVTLGSLDTDGSNFTYRNGTIIANSGTLSIMGRGGSTSLSLYDGYAITGNNGASINITGQIGGTSGTAVSIGTQGNASIVTNGGGNISITANALQSSATALSIGAVVSGTGTAPTISSSGTTTITATAAGSGTAISSTTASNIAATGGLIVNLNIAGTLNSLITGGTSNAGGLTKQGAGTLTLANANTFKGTTLVSAGTLALNNINALQNSTLDTGTSGSQLVTFTVAGANTYNIGDLQGADELAIGTNRISVGAKNATATTTTYSGVISGTSGGLTKVGAGNLILSGQSTIKGDYNANGGTLSLTGVSGTYRSLTGLNVNINNGATVALPSIAGGGFISENVVWTFGSAGGGTLTNSTNFVSRGTSGNKFVTTGGLTNTMVGTINLDGTSGGVGPTFDIAAGTAGAAGLLYTGILNNGVATQTFTKSGTGLMQMSGTSNLLGPVTINTGTLELTGTGTLGTSVASMAISNAGAFKSSTSTAQNITYSISGQGGIIQAGTGAMTLTADNTNFSGNATVNNGSTLNIGNGGTTGSLGTATVVVNGSLVYNRSNNITLANIISGAGTFTQAGTGITTLTANNSYSGQTYVNSGTLSLKATANTAQYGTTQFNIANGAILNFDIANGISTSSYTNTTFTGNGIITKTGAGQLIWGATAGATFNLGAGSLIDVQAGTLVGSSNSNEVWTNNLSSLNIATGAVFGGAEGNIRVDALTGAGALSTGYNASGSITVGVNGTTAGTYNTTAGSATFSGIISSSTSNANVTSLSKSGAGTQILTGGNSYQGITSVNGGTLQIGNAGTTGRIGTGAVTLSNNANLNFVRAAATTITNDINGTGNLNATITGINSDLTLSGTTNITGAVAATATGSILTTTSKNISTTTGVSLAAQNNVALNADISNSTSGAINISAGNNSTTSAATITAAAGTTITQNAAAAVTMTTDALGDLTVAKIVKGTGAGDITVAAGIKLAAGAAGGDVKTIIGNAITNNGTGKTLIYTGSSAESGLMSNLNGALATLYLNNIAGQTQNAASGTAYVAGGGLAGGPSAQVLFREAADVTGSINGATITTNYGDAAPTSAAIISALTATNNGATISAASAAATLVVSSADAIADIANHANIDATNNNFGRLNANATGYAYKTSGSSYATNGASPNVTLIVNKINATITANSDTSKVYDGRTQTVTGFTATGLLSGETESALTSVTATGSGTNAGTYSTTASGTDANYNLSFTNGSLVISKANLSAVGTKVYDASSAFSGNNFTSITGVNGETFTATGSGTLVSANVQSNQALSSLGSLSLTGVGSALTSNYNNLTTAQTSVGVTPAALTVTGTNNATTYTGLAQSNTSATISGAQGSDTFTVSGYGIGTHASPTAYADNLSLTGNGSTSLSNYSITYTNGGLTIGKANLTLSGTRPYDAGTTFAGTYLTATGVNNETFSVLGLGDASNLTSRNVQTNQLLSSISGLSLGSSSNGGLTSNYNTLSTAGSRVNITPATLTVTGANNTTTYNGFTQTNSGATIAGNLGADAFNVIGYGYGTNASTTAYADSLSVTAANGSTSLSNYNIIYTNGGLTIDKAALTIKANNDARFVGQTDRVGFDGVSYTGLVGSETNNVLSGTLNIARQNANTDVSAGAYSGVLTPSGLTSTNYNISYANGDYTIVPADTLLIRTTSQNLSYGSTPTFTAVAEYLDSQDNLIHTLTQTGSANNYTFSDGARGSASFTLKPYTSANTVAANSTSGNIVVGSYRVYADNTVIVGSNFMGSPVFTGTLNITAKPVTATVTNVTKTYDSTTSMSNATVSLIGNIAEDNLTVNGTGTYSQKNAGQGLSYTISNVTLSGLDVGNYFLNGSDTLTASNGIITPAPLVLGTSSVTKNYDGTTSAAGSSQILEGTQLFGNDTLTGATFAFTEPSVGLGNKVVNVSNAIISDGNGGANYAVRYVSNTTSSITGSSTSKSLSWLAQPKDLGFGLNEKHPANTALNSLFDAAPALTFQGFENCKSGATSGCVCTSQSGESNSQAAICTPSNTSDLSVRSQLMHEQNTLEIADLAKEITLAD